MDARPALVMLILLAGCVGGGGQETSPSTSPSIPPPPAGVYKHEINACVGGSQQPVQTSTPLGRFEVKNGYDQIIIAFHESGAGKDISAEIRWVEESNMIIWQKAKHDIVPPSQCPSHSHSGDGETKSVEPGNYTVKINYAGPVAIHMEVTARASKATDSGAANHTHVPR